jgi:hypothetical protein
MDDFHNEKPGIAWTVYLVAIAGLIAVALMALLYLTPKAQAQEPPPGPICAPMSHLIPAWQEVHKERVVWEGTSPTPNGPIELVLMQSASGSWSLFAVLNGIGCLRAAGNSGTPVATDKGI